ncbi:DoxX family protein [Nocardia sp. NPDC059240]|uniref:DoxX family protein n=1 Tax=Nocardia sp. NPDC059240 TaxID=3346786 RepID=UPI0036AEA53A
MNIAYHVVGIVAALWIGFSSFSLFTEKQFVTEPLEQYSVPKSWWNWLATAKGAGALGLIAGFFIPAVGIAAAICLVLYFLGASATSIRAGHAGSAIFPVLYLVPAAATVALQLAR